MNHSNETPSSDASDEFANEPVREIERDGVHYTLLGTAHVSPASAAAVKHHVESGRFDAVAIELCPSRHRALTDPSAWRSMNLFQVIRERKAGMMMASLALAAYQRRIAEQFDIEPGAEMKAAIEASERRDLPLQLIDREIGITLKRTSRRLSWWKRWVLTNGLVLSLFSREKIEEEDIERLKQGDILNETFSEFADQSPELYESLITERDHYMAARLREDNAAHPGRRVLAVLGAGHLAGTAEALTRDVEPSSEVERLDRTPPPSKVWKALPWIILVAVLTGFGIGFSRSPELGWSLVLTWVVINGGLSALGALVARAHPITVLAALCAAPLTSLNPTIGAGMVTGAVEASLRKPRMGDFETLRDDVVQLSGWWKNRVARVFLVFFLSNLGSALGTWIAGASMIRQLAA
ncbi:TraB/GumN family protein [Wenzhouxiangella sp. XN79A]|uniref:TraB/GumN family protein n=1 Tax=Wenzhouxiangella sp. XN79A TaxID=2724193 RepID=UPI00144A619A|nr:TraB/GumN family protein [Wenzhouxiangella sp. XN79A]NKI34091.1 TraB/GumN family protein [Wenzhouxiangella sp. XN79A]